MYFVVQHGWFCLLVCLFVSWFLILQLVKYARVNAQSRKSQYLKKKKSIKNTNFPVFCMCVFDRVAFVMKKHLNTHLLGKHGVGTPKER